MKRLAASMTLTILAMQGACTHSPTHDEQKNHYESKNDYQQKLGAVETPENGRLSYQQLLSQHQLPGLSLAVIDNYQVAFSHVEGVKAFGENALIDQNTAFSTASISKPVTATLAFMLEEQGKLDLDVPVTHYLKRWTLPSSEWTDKTPVTLRHLLSHTAGTTQSGFADFYLGDEIPTPIDSLNGVKVPRYSTPIDFIFEPGTNWQYSGGGYVIVQIALEDVTGQSLAELAESMLFKPLNMQHTTMHQHGDKNFLTNVAKVHDSQQQVIGTGIPICPQIAPSGMWSTPLDMAKWVIAYQKALAGQSTSVISEQVAKNSTEILSISKIGSWAFGGWSAGWMRREDDANREWFSHGGSNTGTGGHLMASMKDGKGLIVFANGDRPARNPVIETIIEHTQQALDWHQPANNPYPAPPSSEAMQIQGRYLSLYDHVITIHASQKEITIENLFGRGRKETLFYVGNHRFGMENSHIEVGMEQGKLTFYRKGSKIKDQSVRKLAKGQLLPHEVAKTSDFSTTLAAFNDWQRQYPSSRLHSANSLNRFGYQALHQDNIDWAIRLFRVYTHLYPKDANAYGSLGEAYWKKGNQPLAKANYQQSLALNPNNQNAQNMLKKIAI